MISSVLIFLVLFVGYIWGQVQSFWQDRQLMLHWQREARQVALQALAVCYTQPLHIFGPTQPCAEMGLLDGS